jgi:hypothetical protein
MKNGDLSRYVYQGVELQMLCALQFCHRLQDLQLGRFWANDNDLQLGNLE